MPLKLPGPAEKPGAGLLSLYPEYLYGAGLTFPVEKG